MSKSASDHVSSPTKRTYYKTKISKSQDKINIAGEGDVLSSSDTSNLTDETESTHSDKTQENKSSSPQNSDENMEPPSFENLKGSFWLTRIVLIRYMGFIYFVAYYVSLNQNRPLLGKNGLLPANVFLNNVRNHHGSSSPWTLFTNVPTLLWFVDFEENIDYWLDCLAWTGLALASLMMITGAGNWPLLLIQWILYHSIANVGQTWFSFGWESQVLETGFLTTFLCPMLSLSSLPKKTPTSKIIIFAYRWLIFRIMLGAGLIKIRGDKCWHDLTCMNYHYETQPVPNPLSYFMHQSPEPFHKFEVLSNHFVELVAPFFLLLTRKLCMFGGAVQILFQVVLIISGNLSFLNWLTILPSLACFDDASYSCFFSTEVRLRVAKLNAEKKLDKWRITLLIRKVFNISFGVLIVYLSIPVVQNLLSPRQAMNTSFDPLRLVNTYGAFGSITKKRTEVIFEGTNSSSPSSPNAVWEEYQFKCKPGDVFRRPCIISPFHYRLDWLMWFAAFQNYNHNPWLIHLAAKFLLNDEQTESLIAFNPFSGRSPPKYVRAEHYRYVFSKIGSPEAKLGQWWKRKKKGVYLHPVSLEMLAPTIKHMGWPVPKLTRGNVEQEL
ncbi:lipase maturation factor 1-like [Physella acuta]|uniref:lipase maturation factor 1-like n=1 Tax=Physella acuta TaxID=109671 RepID=UPI0027DC0B82|nr:lipase maturation factor 1-like [Physella acuta]XP_059154246.1 lipase maturation factor 1-like [Physella acuta]XP_059154247.1 lipase maturation factor 1-like [Physella acuta]XP_059154248.1 lipase maturation factor 1-like [Physella acuta]XP_059154249.1 lipase maturation factor 1-like [Physella acuta]XP_059154250.1 lipase maturation factor 1-like [Physella acuta]